MEPVKPSEASAWPDARLIAAVRVDPPDAAALDVLVGRYWNVLFGRCRLLTLDPQKAMDLAQEAWCRVLRARHALKPEGNFPAYLATTALNVWRDWQRSARRAGPMADHRLASLDAAMPGTDGGTTMLVDAIPDRRLLERDKRARLRLDIDQALERLTPLLREVLVARFLVGESCAEIGRRHERTEQTVSAWVREALRLMKGHLGEAAAHDVSRDL
jgi:RNA polymerase sigma factor (sigma-70 family)